MDQEELARVAAALAGKGQGKGILAADEPPDIMGERFRRVSPPIENTAEARLAYRRLLFTTAGIGNVASGVILHAETFAQTMADGTTIPHHLLAQGVFPGITMDQWFGPLPGSPQEYLTTGLDGVQERCKAAHAAGAKFAKWRAPFFVQGDTFPSQQAFHAQCTLLALYARASQDNGLVPIVEPEIVVEADTTFEETEAGSRKQLAHTFELLKLYGVYLPGIILKTNFVRCGATHYATGPYPAIQIAEKTVSVLKEGVPAEVPGVMFLSGGMNENESAACMAQVNQHYPDAPWALSFSFGRALQERVRQVWQGKAENDKAAQETFLHVLDRMSQASLGRETPAV